MAEMELRLKYGLNPHQKFARLILEGEPPPLRVLNGSPGYINVLDMLAGWQLARELKEASALARAAVARPLEGARTTTTARGTPSNSSRRDGGVTLNRGEA